MYSVIEDLIKTRPRKQKRQVSFIAGLPFYYCWDLGSLLVELNRVAQTLYSHFLFLRR
jgi:hypothetical protein